MNDEYLFRIENVCVNIIGLCISHQLGEWVFVASGTGLLPQPQEPVSVYTEAGSNTTMIIPFRNPMDHAVLVDVSLKGQRHCCLHLTKTIIAIT